MSGNTFGQIFKVTTFGESHGGAVGCVIDGCPPLIELSTEEIEAELKRRATGQSAVTSQRKEEDKVQILSGTFEGKTIGSPICMLVFNTDAKSEDYVYLKDKYRPSHSDFTYEKKYGIRAWAGGGRASARETTARVMAGALAKKILKQEFGIEILGFVSKVKNIEANVDPNTVTYEQVEKNVTRCPDDKASREIEELILNMQKEGNSVGGVITCVARNVPVGFGDPVFDKLEADLAKAVMSIPATKGFEVGSGFAGTNLTGLEHNDAFYTDDKGNIRTRTNNSGGIQGGISNGENIIIKIAFKPTSTINSQQESVNNKGEGIKLENIKGRHDPCVTPRAVPIVEAMVALTLVDHFLRDRAQMGAN
ncbi:chorismate synthase [Candidatus Dojkabacteria bacterium]|nr:chorismate synthase [Candidatus Dojkabacteria bacterium]